MVIGTLMPMGPSIFAAFNTAKASTTTRISAVEVPLTSRWAQVMALTLHWMLRKGARNR